MREREEPAPPPRVQPASEQAPMEGEKPDEPQPPASPPAAAPSVAERAIVEDFSKLGVAPAAVEPAIAIAQPAVAEESCRRVRSPVRRRSRSIGARRGAKPSAEVEMGSAPEESAVEYTDVDWSAQEPAPECGVEVTPAVLEELSQDLDAEAAGLSARRADAVEVRVALCDFLAFMNAARGQGMPQNAGLDYVRAMKARGVEHVRYRCASARRR